MAGPGSSGNVALAVRLLFFFALFMGLYTVASLLVTDDLYVQSLVLLLAAAGAGALMLRRDGRSIQALGFYLRRSAFAELGRGTVLGSAVAVSAVLVIASAGGIRWTGDEGGIVAWIAQAGVALAFFAVPAAAEEALFRGYPMQVIAREKGPWIALLVMSAVFAAAHSWNPGLTGIGIVNLFAAGLLLGAVYLRTGSLWWATGAHIGWNWSMGFLADLPVSGLDLVDAPLVSTALTGPQWLTGGPFGPEGSAITAVILVGATVALWKAPRFTATVAAVECGSFVPAPSP